MSSSTSEGYNFSLTTFTSSGKLGQLEHSLAAVNRGSLSIGIKATNGVVLVSEKKVAGYLVQGESVEKIFRISPSIGCTYAGLGPDTRQLVKLARKAAETYYLTYDEYPQAKVLVTDVASTIQDYTQSGGVRPFGVSLLVAGLDSNRQPQLFQVDPSGMFFAWRATAIGKNMQLAKSFLEKRCKEVPELEDAIHTALLALKDSFDGQMNETNVEIGVLNAATGLFTKLSVAQTKEYIDNL